jgi:polygalacturonase
MVVMLAAASIAALLAHAKPGDTVVIPAGDYGPETISGLSFSPAVTLDARALKSTNITFQDVTGLHVQGGTWANAIGETWAGHTWAVAVTCQRCHDVAFDGATVSGPPLDAPGRDFAGYGISFIDSDHVAVANSKITGFKMGVGFTRTSDFSATGNDFGFMTSDGIDVGQGWRGRIEDNVFHDTHIIEKEHPDGIQLWSRLDTPPTSDIVIRRNKVTGATQGISAFDEPGGYDRIVIEDNEVAVSYADGISLVKARDSIIRNNRVSTMNHARYQATYMIKPDDGSVKHCGNTAEPWGGKSGWSDGACRAR